MNKSHDYIAGIQHSMAITPLLQSHLLEFCTDLPFQRGVDLLETALPSVQANSSQTQRLMQHFGNLEQMNELLQEPGFGHSSDQIEPAVEVLYLQADRSDYLAHLGKHTDFIDRLNPLIKSHLKNHPDAQLVLCQV